MDSRSGSPGAKIVPFPVRQVSPAVQVALLVDEAIRLMREDDRERKRVEREREG